MLRSFYNVHFIPLYLFWKFVTLISLTFHSCPHPHSLWCSHPFILCIYDPVSVLMYLFMFFRFHIFFNYSSIDRHFVYSHILGIVINARSEMSVLYASSILKLLRNIHIVFFSDCPIIHSHPGSPHKCSLSSYILINTCYFLTFWW